MSHRLGGRPLAGALLLAAVLAAACAPRRDVTGQPPVRLWVDQVGYRPGSPKVAIAASDVPLPGGLVVEALPERGGRAAWRSTGPAGGLRAGSGSARDPESGDYTAHVDFTALRAPGAYRLVARWPGGEARSHPFVVAHDVFRPVALAAWKAMYFQRADTAKPPRYAGVWSHGLPHHGPHQATAARVYRWNGGKHWEPVGSQLADPTPRNVVGGWWDAGDFSKYTGNTVVCHNELLLAVQLLGTHARDGVGGIPESGNGAPDALDEVRWCTEYLIRLADDDGAAFGKVYEKGACPPEADRTPVQITAPTSGATMARAAALAYAALAWRDARRDPEFAARCLRESLRSWRLLERRPHPWPADARDPRKAAYTGDWFSADYGACRALAAACYRRLTGEPRWADVAWGVLSTWRSLPPGEQSEKWPAIWVALHDPATPAPRVARLRKLLTDAADAAVAQSGPDRGYAVGVRGYWWGSNRLVSACGASCVLGAALSRQPAARARYEHAAEEYAHYLLGRNPVGICYFSNLRSIGAEDSVTTMFHSWVGKDGEPAAAKYIGEGPGKVGPFPGMLVGGANGSMRRYVRTLDWRQSPWEYNEPDITYQSPAIVLLSWVGLRAPEEAPAPRPGE